jgi:flagellar basal-body rod modification protein FlgD
MDPMDTASILNTAQSAAATGANNPAESRLVGDYNSFLLLLTTQLKNQDPLAPLDATQFVSQLSQFASVEQAIVGNQKLDQIIKSMNANSMMADIGMIGRSVEVPGSVAELRDGVASLTYRLDKDAAQAAVVIRDESGAAVRTLAVEPFAGEHQLVWDGTDSAGNPLADGIYSFTFGAADTAGKPVSTQAYVTATVVRVETSASGSSLVLSNGIHTPSSAVRAVLQT